MIEFHPVRLADKEAIQAYTLHGGMHNCDLSFANMFCWEFMYRSAWAVERDFLLIRFQIDGGEQIGYMQPVGEGDFSHLIPCMREDAHRHGQRLRIIGLTEQGYLQLRNAHPDLFAFDSNRDMEDYLYRADDLAQLPGRKYQSKRNHINRFTSEHPSYRYLPLRRELFDECMRFEQQWRMAHTGHSDELCAEQRAMRRAFADFEQLGLEGGCIFADDRLVAFTYGSAVSEQTFCVHVEKADTSFDGAYTIINRCFAEQLAPRYRWINREEDLGIDGLRRSKLSYHPAELVRKYTAIHLHPDECAVKALWREAFGDEDPFIDRFLIRHYARERMLCIEQSGRILSMLHLIPFRSELGRTTYIYGVATATDSRGQGLASELMRRALRTIAEWGDDAAVLIPSDEGLRAFYTRFGFAGNVPVSFRSTGGFDFGTGDTAQDRAMIRLCGASAQLPEGLELTYAG